MCYISCAHNMSLHHSWAHLSFKEWISYFFLYACLSNQSTSPIRYVISHIKCEEKALKQKYIQTCVLYLIETIEKRQCNSRETLLSPEFWDQVPGRWQHTGRHPEHWTLGLVLKSAASPLKFPLNNHPVWIRIIIKTTNIKLSLEMST